jgi:hypothetical protein
MDLCAVMDVSEGSSMNGLCVLEIARIDSSDYSLVKQVARVHTYG